MRHVKVEGETFLYVNALLNEEPETGARAAKLVRQRMEAEGHQLRVPTGLLHCGHPESAAVTDEAGVVICGVCS